MRFPDWGLPAISIDIIEEFVRNHQSVYLMIRGLGASDPGPTPTGALFQWP